MYGDECESNPARVRSEYGLGSSAHHTNPHPSIPNPHPSHTNHPSHTDQPLRQGLPATELFPRPQHRNTGQPALGCGLGIGVRLGEALVRRLTRNGCASGASREDDHLRHRARHAPAHRRRVVEAGARPPASLALTHPHVNGTRTAHAEYRGHLGVRSTPRGCAVQRTHVHRPLSA